MIGRKSVLIVTTHYFIDFLGWIGIVVLAKLWGDFAPEAIGIIGFGMSFISLFNIFTDLGFSAAHVKRISEGKDLGTCIGTFAAIKLLLTLIMIVSVFTTIYLMKNVFNTGFYDATTESVIIVLIFHSVFNNLQNIATQTFTGKREIAKLQVTKMFENIVKVPLSIIVALAGVSVLGTSISPEVQWPEFLQPLQKFIATHATGALAMTYVFGMMATFIVGTWVMRNYPIKKPKLSYAKSYFSFALPLAISSAIATVSHNIDKIMIGYFWASADVGYYFSVQRILGFISILYLSVGTILFPTISNKHALKDMDGVKYTVHLAERYISMVMIPPIIFVCVFPESLIQVLLDPAFIPAAPILIMLTFYIFLRGMTTPYSSTITGINRTDILGIFGVVICLTNIVLNYLIIPKDGILSFINIKIASYVYPISGAMGAAFATVLSYLIAFIGMRLVAKKLTGISLFQSHTPRHIIAGLIMGVTLTLFAFHTGLFPIIRWYSLVLFGLIGLALYIGILYLFKEFKKDDLKFFLSIIHPKEMFSYVKEELKGEKKGKK